MPRTRKRFGQHFLESVWADKVVDAIQPAPTDVFLEIGPGPGILTLKLAPRVSRLVAIEIDRDLVAALTPKLPSNASVVSGDVLDFDIDTALSALDTPIRIAGNLPYNISSPILFRLLELASRRPITDATLMLQREVAERIVAKPGTAEYGVLSVLTQWRAEAARVLAIPPGAFRPPPDVRSALVRLSFRAPAFELRDSRPFRADGTRHVYATAKDARQCAAALCRRHRGRSGPRPRRGRYRPPPAAGDAGGY